MRASVSDRRLEAIAGTPGLITQAPIWKERGDNAFAVFVGELKAPEPEPQVALQSRESAGSPATHNIWLAAGTMAPTFTGVAERLTLMPGLVAGTILLTDRYMGLGVNYVPAQSWKGRFAIAAYDRALTDAEALAVALSLSLSLSG